MSEIKHKVEQHTEQKEKTISPNDNMANFNKHGLNQPKVVETKQETKIDDKTVSDTREVRTDAT